MLLLVEGAILSNQDAKGGNAWKGSLVHCEGAVITKTPIMKKINGAPYYRGINENDVHALSSFLFCYSAAKMVRRHDFSSWTILAAELPGIECLRPPSK